MLSLCFAINIIGQIADWFSVLEEELDEPIRTNSIEYRNSNMSNWGTDTPFEFEIHYYNNYGLCDAVKLHCIKSNIAFELREV
jgi:hypothetical protein